MSSCREPRVCAGILANDRAIGAISPAPSHEPPHRRQRFGRPGAEASGRLQGVLEVQGGVPPIEHHRRPGQGLALQAPQPSVAIAQHGGRRVRLHAGHSQHLLERIAGPCQTVADKSEA